MRNPNFYERFYHFTNAGWDKDAAESLANSNVSTDDFEAQTEYMDDIQEHLDDLESRGFFNGTDDLYLDEQITQGQIQQDRIDMFRNEY